MSLRNTILAGATNNAWGTILDEGFNMSSDGSAAFGSGTSFNFTDPKLGPLADNGGPTRTMSVLPGSPAIDFGTAFGATATDQRGAPRPYGPGVDMGAVETGPLIPPLIVTRNGDMLVFAFQGQAGVSYRIERSPDLSTWFHVEDTGPMAATGIVSRSYPFSQPAQFFRIRWDWD